MIKNTFKKYKFLAIFVFILFVASFSFSLATAPSISYWANLPGNNLVTNTGNGLANADIHVAHCYIGLGTGTPCGGGGGGISYGGTVTTGHDTQVLYIDNSGNLTSDHDFTRDPSNNFFTTLNSNDGVNFTSLELGPTVANLLSENGSGGTYGVQGDSFANKLKLFSNVTTWLWPQIDGSAGQALVTDGLGNLSFGTPSSTIHIGEAIGGGAPTNILYTDNSGNLFGDNQFYRDSVTHFTQISTEPSTGPAVPFAILGSSPYTVTGPNHTGAIAQYKALDGAGHSWGIEGHTPSSLGPVGQTIISSDSTDYIWPHTDGSAGDVLTTDGAGNLSFAPATNTVWKLLGNAGTVDGTNFLGTTDDIPLTFKMNNVVSGRIDDGAVTGLNTTALGYSVAVSNTGNYLTAIGFGAGSFNDATDLIAIGPFAAYGNTVAGTDVIAIGNSVAQGNSGVDLVAMGFEAAFGNIGNSLTSIGFKSTFENTGNVVTAFGYQAGYKNAGANVIALGENSSYDVLTSTGNALSNSLFIGPGNSKESLVYGIYDPSGAGANQEFDINGKLGFRDSTLTYHTYLIGGSQAADISYTLPTAQATEPMQTFFNDGSGNLSWKSTPTVLYSSGDVDATMVGNSHLISNTTSKNLNITSAIIRVTLATAVTVPPTLSIGTNLAHDNIYASTIVTGLNSTTVEYTFTSVGITHQVAPAEQVGLAITSGATATAMTIQVDLIGYYN